MNVTFEKLIVHNFMSIVDLEFDFSSPKFRGINLILGENLSTYKEDDDDHAENTVGSDASNGAGKTTLFSALCFTLFGDSIKHTEAVLIPNRSINPKEPVSLDLTVNTDGKRYHILRTLTGKSRKTTLTVSEILEGGEEKDLTLSTVKLTQSFICNAIVGCNMSIFLRSVLLRNDESNNFFTLDKAAKVKFIEELFDLGVFTEMYSEIHREKLDNDKSLFGLGQVKMSLERNLASAKQSFDGWHDDTDEEVERKKKRLEEIVQEIETKKSELETVSSDVAEKKKKLEMIESRFPAQREKVNGLYGNVANIKSELAIAKNDIDTADKMMSTHHRTRDILCDDCRGKFDNLVHFGEYEAKKNAALEKTEDLRLKLADAMAEYDAEKEKLAKGEKILSAKKSELFSAQSTENRIKTEIASLTRDGKSTKEFIEAPKKPKTNPYGVMVEKAEKDIADNSNQMTDMEKIVRKMAVLEGVVSPDTIRNIVISGLVNELNTRIKYYLQRMGATYTCVFDSSLDYRFVTTSGETGYGNFSKGEEMRLSVATTLAFRDFMLVRINTRTNILLIDEYLDSSLDRLAKRGIMTLFSEFVSDNSNMGVFLITHDEYIKNMDFSSVMKFTKDGDVSTLSVDFA